MSSRRNVRGSPGLLSLSRYPRGDISGLLNRAFRDPVRDELRFRAVVCTPYIVMSLRRMTVRESVDTGAHAKTKYILNECVPAVAVACGAHPGSYCRDRARVWRKHVQRAESHARGVVRMPQWSLNSKRQ